MLSIARSKSIWGPFESYEKNPILTADGSDEYIQNVGHGELFQSGDGQWWAAVLRVRRKDRTRYTMGRETFLTPVTWPTGEWPQIQQPKMCFLRKSPGAPDQQAVPWFKQKHPRVEDVFIRGVMPDGCSIAPHGSEVILAPSTSTMTSLYGNVSFVGRRQRTLDCIASVTVSINTDNVGKSVDAGLAIYKDSFRHAEIFYDQRTSELCFTLHGVLTEELTFRRKSTEGMYALDLRIRGTEEKYDFEYRSGMEDAWSSLGTVDTYEMTAHDFIGPMFGVFAFGPECGNPFPVRFSDFIVIPPTTVL